MTLYTTVTSNRRKTFFYLVVYVALILVLGQVAAWFFGNQGIFVGAAVFAVVQGWVSYYYSDSVALGVAKAVPLDPVKYRDVYKLVENLSITAGLPMPRLFLIDDTAMNAFATGRDAKHAAIAVTSGLLDRLDSNELQGVLAHELAHVGNEDIKLMSMVMVMAGLIALVSDFMLRSMWFGGGNRNNENNNSNGVMLLVAIGLAILAPIAATLIQMAISRKREFMADSTAVLLTRYPEGMISALKKISGDTEPLEVANRATAHMYFSNPLHGRVWLANLFSTHPPVEQRIRALEVGGGVSL